MSSERGVVGAWADLPERFGKWNSVWRRFNRWSVNGIWQQLMAVLDALDLEELQLDSTTLKAHSTASGSRRMPLEKKRMRTSVAASADRGEA